MKAYIIHQTKNCTSTDQLSTAPTISFTYHTDQHTHKHIAKPTLWSKSKYLEWGDMENIINYITVQPRATTLRNVEGRLDEADITASTSSLASTAAACRIKLASSCSSSIASIDPNHTALTFALKKKNKIKMHLTYTYVHMYIKLHSSSDDQRMQYWWFWSGNCLNLL